MARRQQKQLLPIDLPICLMFVVSLLLIKVDRGSATNMSLDDDIGNMLQPQQQNQHQQPLDNSLEEHNYAIDRTKQGPVAADEKITNSLEIDANEESQKGNSLSDDLTENQTIFGNSYDPITMVKRAPGGFVGMRGKKLYNENEDTINENDSDIGFAFTGNHLENSDDEVYRNEYIKANVRRYKKTPTAFYGVRGKKFATINGGSSNSDINHWQDFLEKLEEEHIRKAILHEFIERIAGTKNELQNEMTKRAPTGFTGVRGKRPSLDEIELSMETLSKRGLGSNAFVGVRGKKDVSHQTFKRSPPGAERYFFVFWKKSLPIGGVKRQRFVDLNNKFVAVRGKKNSYEAFNGFNDLNTKILPPSSAMSLFYGKRTPNGFVGMRGKRPLSADDILSTID